MQRNRILGLALFLLISASSQAQIALVHSDKASSDGADTTISCPAMSTTTGNLISIAFRQTNDQNLPSSVTDTAMNSYTGMGQCDIGGVNADAMTHYYAKNITGNAANVVTVTWSGPEQFRAIICDEISGADTSDPLDQVATGRASLASSVSSDSYTTTQADEILLGFVGTGSLTATYTPDTGYTLNQTVASKDAAAEYKVVSGIQTGVTTSMTMDDTSNMCIVAATFKAAGSPPPPTTNPTRGAIF